MLLNEWRKTLQDDEKLSFLEVVVEFLKRNDPLEMTILYSIKVRKSPFSKNFHSFNLSGIWSTCIRLKKLWSYFCCEFFPWQNTFTCIWSHEGFPGETRLYEPPSMAHWDKSSYNFSSGRSKRIVPLITFYFTKKRRWKW